MPAFEYHEVLEAVKVSYDDRIRAILCKARDAFREAGMAANEPMDMSGDTYLWYLGVWPTASAGDITDSTDVSITIQEAMFYGDDNSPFGISFSIDVVDYGGGIRGSFAPFNFTDDCWVDGRDPNAVESRFQILEAFDVSVLPDLLKD